MIAFLNNLAFTNNNNSVRIDNSTQPMCNNNNSNLSLSNNGIDTILNQSFTMTIKSTSSFIEN